VTRSGTRMRARLIHRRDVIALLGTIASGPPGALRAQQPDARRRVGVLMNLAADDSEGQRRVTAFREALQNLGWIVGRNILIDYRWGAADAERYRKSSAELAALNPDVLLAGGGQVIEPLQAAAPATPIVFTNTNDPITLGFVASLSRPGGNITGFINIEYSISGKWLELLKAIAPSVMRAIIIWDSGFAAGKAQLAELLRVAPKVGLHVTQIDLRGPTNLEDAIGGLGAETTCGLVVTASTFATVRRQQIISLAARYRLPAVYSNRLYVDDGGLISYGPDFLDQYRRAADYVNRILNGARPAELPVEAPRTYETVLNVTTAEELGLQVPRVLLLQSTDVVGR
jgi:putative tryptophan/tyrosine transport system substrate-binding protein